MSPVAIRNKKISHGFKNITRTKKIMFIELYKDAKCRALDAIKNGKNIVLCGMDCTGKSFLMQELSSKLNSQGYYLGPEFSPRKAHKLVEFVKYGIGPMSSEKWLVEIQKIYLDDFKKFLNVHRWLLRRTVIVEMPHVRVPDELMGTPYPKIPKDIQFLRSYFGH